MNGLLVCPTRGKNSVFTFVMKNAMETQTVFILGNSGHSSSSFVCVVLFSFLISFFPPKMVENSLYLYAEGNELHSVEVGEVGSSSIDFLEQEWGLAPLASLLLTLCLYLDNFTQNFGFNHHYVLDSPLSQSHMLGCVLNTFTGCAIDSVLIVKLITLPAAPTEFSVVGIGTTFYPNVQTRGYFVFFLNKNFDFYLFYNQMKCKKKENNSLS